jgi:hypothetical protein
MSLVYPSEGGLRTDIPAMENSLLDRPSEALNIAQAHVQALASQRMDRVRGIANEHRSGGFAFTDIHFRMIEPEREGCSCIRLKPRYQRGNRLRIWGPYHSRRCLADKRGIRREMLNTVSLFPEHYFCLELSWSNRLPGSLRF